MAVVSGAAAAIALGVVAGSGDAMGVVRVAGLLVFAMALGVPLINISTTTARSLATSIFTVRTCGQWRLRPVIVYFSPHGQAEKSGNTQQERQGFRD